ncbi:MULTISPECIES: diacylglycerol kinase family protein [unclassified Adlercreutzia]|uniref:diacylglycerol/lipid kinase family protein n=1 Tax=unclassified Adlercreutzia TaxID=2636013 RepID=UPI00197CDACD|nr:MULTISPECIES: diacylglycerol kinase family protein [unclassified Adlercreutzia]
MNRFRRIAVVVNPAARNGAGAQAASRVEEELLRAFGTPDAFDVMLTAGPGHAAEIAEHLHQAYGTVLAVGGDGLVHEVAGGLMRRDEVARPMLGVIPMGSGDDYAATLGMSSRIERAVAQVLECNACLLDVGCVNGEFFVETLSFGLDAAIALDTVERRRRTGRTGTLLYLESGIDQMLHHLVSARYEAKLEGGEGVAGDAAASDATADAPVSGEPPAPASAAPAAPADAPAPAGPARAISGESYLFAVQIGPTYGGRFKVCPQADPADGLFDICLAHPPLNSLSAMVLFLLAKGGHHVRFRQIEQLRARRLEVTFDRPLAAQADGERIEGTRFCVDMVPRALKVLMG